jgi:uncharacterized protein
MTTTASPVAEWLHWHSGRERDLAVPHGWLSLVGFHWLPDRPSGLPGLPGRFRVQADSAVLITDASDGYCLPEDGELGATVAGEQRAEVAEGRSLLWLRRGDTVVELIRRGGRLAIRVRDPKAPTRLGFRGVPIYDHDENWVRSGIFRPWAAARQIAVHTAREGLRQHIAAVGVVSVDIDKGWHDLVATQAPGGNLVIAFHDLTNDVETAGWRSVLTTEPDSAGNVIVDFNRSTNFPSAFTVFGSCPRPVRDNNLLVPVTAGEKAPAAPVSVDPRDSRRAAFE